MKKETTDILYIIIGVLAFAISIALAILTGGPDALVSG